MIEFPKEAKFKYPWRKYQQRVLDSLEDYLIDRHLHVIAPPGSGKTVLGLEVALRLNQPTLILAPTILIRNQWIQRFCVLFLQTEQRPDWISTDIRNPGFLTVVTYQGLHSACNNLNVVNDDYEAGEERESSENIVVEKVPNTFLNQIVDGLKAQQVKTIVVDEAHHLQNEWWQTLTKIKKSLDPVIVGLTATPPYDVTPNEWQRYLELNGPVDIEIAVPELVIEGDLCPHQDYIYFSLPTAHELENISDFRGEIQKLFYEIRNDETLIKAITNHPIWLKPLDSLDWIYNNLSYYSAALIFLNDKGIEIPETHLDIIGNKHLKIPVFDYGWMEIILDFYLYKGDECFNAFHLHRKDIERKLRRTGAMEKQQISFSHNKEVNGFLTSSISKLNSIKRIVDFEYNKLGQQLRLVILSDYIRKEFYTDLSENNLELNKIGVIPIFEKLRRENINHVKIAVLTGSIIIIPKSAYPLFEEKVRTAEINNVICFPLPYDPEYILIRQTEQLKREIVHLITEIFQTGEIEILIGTKSLLGEGWDAPAINSLILASFVGSFVLSNQMRGRAIRAQNNNAEKTGNIWHLACIDPTSLKGGDDLALLKRRFRSFVGVSFKSEPGIENGAGRLNIPVNIRQPEEIERMNMETFRYAGDRESLKERWGIALKSGFALVEEIKIPFSEKQSYKGVKKLYFNKTIGYLFTTIIVSFFGFLAGFPEALLKGAKNIRSMEDFYAFLAIFISIGVLLLLRKTFAAFRLYIKYRDIGADIHQIGEALLNTLINMGVIQTDRLKLKVESRIDPFGSVYCHLKGGTAFESSVFINTLKETIGPIDNPKYVITRKSSLFSFINREDFHSVPEIIGRNKQSAQYFKAQWHKLVGSSDLIFTRTIEGRKLLLKSRIKSLASQFDDQVEHVSKWR